MELLDGYNPPALTLNAQRRDDFDGLCRLLHIRNINRVSKKRESQRNGQLALIHPQGEKRQGLAAQMLLHRFTAINSRQESVAFLHLLQRADRAVSPKDGKRAKGEDNEHNGNQRQPGASPNEPTAAKEQGDLEDDDTLDAKRMPRKKMREGQRIEGQATEQQGHTGEAHSGAQTTGHWSHPPPSKSGVNPSRYEADLPHWMQFLSRQDSIVY